MATIRDVYEISSKANLAGLNEATKALTRNSRTMQMAASAAAKLGASGPRALIRIAANATKAAANFVKANVSLRGMSAALRNIARVGGRAFAGAIRGAGMLGARLRSAIPIIGMAVAAFGLLAGAVVRGIGAMRDSYVEEAEAAVGATSGLDDNAAAAEEAASSIGDAAAASAEASEKMRGTLGAMGDVGAGFVMAQSTLTKEVSKQADNAVVAAVKAKDAMDATESAMGGGIKTTNRFVDAVDRIGAAFDVVGGKLRDAFAKAATPALEKFADLLESETFQEFVDLLAEDLADILTWVANWLIKEGIPKLEEWMEKINEVGGPIAALKKWWRDLRNTTAAILISMGRAVAAFSQRIKFEFTKIRDFVLGIWETIEEAFERVKETIVVGLEIAFKQAANVVIAKLNDMIDAINKFIKAVNGLASILSIKGLPLIPKIPFLQEGGVVTDPTLAVLGERGPEAVIPLDQLGGVGGGGVTIHSLTIHVANPAEASSFIRALNARGVQVPVLL